MMPVEAIPACLRQLPQWVGWKTIPRDGKPTKCPINPKTGQMADSTDASTWGTFDEAMAAYQSQSLSGVGFVFTGEAGLCGVDLDDSVDPATGAIKPWAREIVERLNSYTEISPSGCGVKIFLCARKLGTRCRKAYQDGDVEIYDTGRFFTVTARRVEGVSADVESRQAELDELYRGVFGEISPATPSPAQVPGQPAPGPAPALADDEIIAKACGNRRNGAKFSALWAGRWNEHFNSASEADGSVVFTLAFYTKDPGQIDRMFRRSGLMRDKWDEYHGPKTYGETTIAKALENVKGQYKARPSRKSAPSSPPSASAGDGADQSGQQTMAPLGTRDSTTGKLILSTARTLPTAEAYVRDFCTHPEGRTTHSYAGLMMGWCGNRYVEIEDETVKNRLQPWLHDSVHYVWNRRTQEMELQPFPANPQTVRSALDSVRMFTHLPASLTPPFWLGDAGGKPNPRELLTCRSLNLHIPTGHVFPGTPALFNINALEFDYDPDAAVPEQWLAFLNQLWGDDVESIQLLQEWFGYCLTGDTSQQKMLLLLGPRRCGKGTIGRVLTRLVGAGNVAGPTTSSLAGSFGLQPLIGKSLAVVSDARFHGDDIPIVVERLLCISGEDTLTIDRKHVGSVTMKLPTRFVFLTNELPGVSDASGALAGRFMVLRFTNSFFGREDTTLTDKLLTELPGILLWALQGWRRLRANGRFVQPASVEDSVDDLEDLLSPVGAFVRARCTLGAPLSVEACELFDAWREYCLSVGRRNVGTIQTFGRDLRATIPGLKVSQPRMAGGRLRWYEGIALDCAQGCAHDGAQGGAQ